MRPKVLLNEKQLSITLDRLCKQLIENHGDFSESVIIGVQPRGVFFANRIYKRLSELLPKSAVLKHGQLDPTFYRDDFRMRTKPLEVNSTNIEFSIKDKKVILIDDVFYTGRTIRASLDALLDFGRPSKVELMVLITRKYSHHLPIQPDYEGKKVDSIEGQEVVVKWIEEDEKDEILLFTKRQSKS